jgi:hypothetical protein
MNLRVRFGPRDDAPLVMRAEATRVPRIRPHSETAVESGT